MKKVAIVYHYLAHYRLPIFQELMKDDSIQYTLISGDTSEININKIPTTLATQEPKNGGLRWHILKNSWILKDKFLWQHGLISIIQENKYDAYIFLGNPYHISTWFSVIIARLNKKKVFYWMHGFYKKKITSVDYIKLFLFYQLANGFFLYGNRAKKRLEELGIKTQENINVIYNSLDYENSLRFRRQIDQTSIFNFRLNLFKDPSLPTICFIGRVNLTKRIDLLIEVQKLNFQKSGSPLFNLLVIGDGDELINLISFAKTGIDVQNNTAFVGAIYREEEIANLIQHSDLCVIPGEVGLTAMHSLTYGTPVISHDNLDIQMPEVEAIIPDITGDLYIYENLEDLRDKIDKWIQKYPVKSTKLIERCYEVIDKYYNPNYQSSVFKKVLLANLIDL